MPTGAPLSGQCVITREIAVAEGVFAPGHLGELTRIVPFEMVDEALAATGTTQSRLRKLPARGVVYLLLAAGLFEQIGYLSVWCKLTSALDGLPIPTVTATALWHARARLGVRPIRALFDLLRGPAATALTDSYGPVTQRPSVPGRLAPKAAPERAHVGTGTHAEPARLPGECL
ncbi:transposase domain-containing protein [Streptomyces sp. NPDC002076]